MKNNCNKHLMIKHPKLFTLALVIFFVPTTMRTQTDEEAKQMLLNIAEAMMQRDSRFEFTYKLENLKEDVHQEISGNITISGQRYKVNFLDTTQFSDGENTYLIVPENKEITISKQGEPTDFQLNPVKLLQEYETGYQFSWDIVQKTGDKRIQYIKLVPTNEDHALQYLLVGIDTANKCLQKLIEIDKNNTRTTLSLLKQEKGIQLPDDFFSFNSENYPGYYINN